MNPEKCKCTSHDKFLSPLLGCYFVIFPAQGLHPWLYAFCPLCLIIQPQSIQRLFKNMFYANFDINLKNRWPSSIRHYIAC